MNRINPLAGLIGYGDSDDDSDDGAPSSIKTPGAKMAVAHGSYAEMSLHPPGVHPAPISHCPWSACYDESSGFTYYWNQHTNAVTWEAPPEYLLALRVAQQQLQTQNPSEVSAEEWQLYQQALADKQGNQGKAPVKAVAKSVKTNQKFFDGKNNSKKRKYSDVEDEKIELITSYHNSDSESNDEPESPVKVTTPPSAKIPKNTKKSKQKPSAMAYGPALPPNQEYTVPIGPEMPPELQKDKPKSPKRSQNKDEISVSKIEEKPTVIEDNEDSQDESALLNKLKDKAQLLERLGGEIPSELHKIIYDDNDSSNKSLKSKESIDAIDNIDDLLNEIEKKELPKIKSRKGDKSNDGDIKSNETGDVKSPKSREVTPPLEAKPLFPSIKNITENDINVPKNNQDNKNVDKNEVIINAAEKKGVNLYLMNTEEPIENIQRKKLRISNSVLPERKRQESPVYTTKYAQSIDGFTGERTGLGFSKDDQVNEDSSKTTSLGNMISYGNGLTFTKGETLNEEKRDEDLDDLTELVEAKLKYLNQLQPCTITPVQEMLIQMQTLVGAFRGGALSEWWWRRWTQAGARALTLHEAAAAPAGWTLAFQRSEGRYQYKRESDGLVQWEYPAVADTDMDICTTPPHPGLEVKEEPPPLPRSPVQTAPPPPAPPATPAPPVPTAPPAPPAPPAPTWRAHTPPPPTWADPPPPGCDDLPPLPNEKKREIGDELMSFYSDIAELEKHTSEPPTASSSPEPAPPPRMDKEKERDRERDRDRESRERERERKKDRDRQKEKDRDKREKESKVAKKKSKVKISTSMGIKHKSVSSLVAKWQQVADEINSD